MAKTSKQKSKLLYLMRILLEQTDEAHPMTVQQMIDELARYDIRAERKSVYDDLEVLKTYGLDIIRIQGKTFQYFVGSRDFELAELKLLVDIVQHSKFITAKKSNELIAKLEQLTSRYNAQQLHREVYIADRAKNANELIYYNIDMLHTAIAQNRKISFQYDEWVILRHPRTSVGKRKELAGRRFIANPIGLVWSDEKYYLVSYRGNEIDYFHYPDEQFVHYRVDEMHDIHMLEQARELPDFPFDIAKYSKSLFSMYSGKEETVTLICNNSLLGTIIDRYGRHIPITEVDETHFKVRIKVAVSDMFFAFVMGRGKKIEILSPAWVRQKFQEKLSEIMEVYSS